MRLAPVCSVICTFRCALDQHVARKAPNDPEVPDAYAIPARSLENRVAEYFDSAALGSKGNGQLYAKAIVIMGGMIGLYIHLIFFTPAWYFALPECVLLGMFITGTGFNVMHD